MIFIKNYYKLFYGLNKRHERIIIVLLVVIVVLYRYTEDHMKRIIDKARHQLYDYWTRMMASSRVKMSLGAQYLSKIIPWARRDNWRGQREKKK